MAMLSYRNTLQLLISQQLARNMLSAVGPGSGPADGRLTIRVPVVALIDLLGPTAKYTLAVGTHMLLPSEEPLAIRSAVLALRGERGLAATTATGTPRSGQLAAAIACSGIAEIRARAVSSPARRTKAN